MSFFLKDFLQKRHDFPEIFLILLKLMEAFCHISLSKNKRSKVDSKNFENL